MHFPGSIRMFPLSARVGQAEMQAFRHHSGQSVLRVGCSGGNSRSMTTARGRFQGLHVFVEGLGCCKSHILKPEGQRLFHDGFFFQHIRSSSTEDASVKITGRIGSGQGNLLISIE